MLTQMINLFSKNGSKQFEREKKCFPKNGAGRTGEACRSQSLLHIPHKDLLEMGYSPKTKL